MFGNVPSFPLLSVYERTSIIRYRLQNKKLLKRHKEAFLNTQTSRILQHLKRSTIIRAYDTIMHIYRMSLGNDMGISYEILYHCAGNYFFITHGSAHHHGSLPFMDNTFSLTHSLSSNMSQIKFKNLMNRNNFWVDRLVLFFSIDGRTRNLSAYIIIS